VVRLPVEMLFAAIGIFSALADDCTYFSGSGGCDVSDIECVNQQPELWSFKRKNANLSPQQKLDIGGVPSWIKTDGRCVFVTVTDSHFVISYELANDDKLVQKSKVDLSPSMNPVFIDKIGDVIIVANYHGDDTDGKQAGAASLSVSADCSLKMGDFVQTTGK
jgi:6-phosphogluconolactonase (cycloisomerase 2 family)